MSYFSIIFLMCFSAVALAQCPISSEFIDKNDPAPSKIDSILNLIPTTEDISQIPSLQKSFNRYLNTFTQNIEANATGIFMTAAQNAKTADDVLAASELQVSKPKEAKVVASKCQAYYNSKCDSLVKLAVTENFNRNDTKYKQLYTNKEYLKFINSYPIWVDSIKGGAYTHNLLLAQADSIRKVFLNQIGDVNAMIDSAWIQYGYMHKELVLQIAESNDTVSSLTTTWNNIVAKSHILSLNGEVTAVSGTTITLLGTSYSSNCNSAEECDDESNAGAVHSNENIQISGYNSKMKVEGTAVVGEQLMLDYCVFAGKSSGKNRFGAMVPVYLYKPSGQMATLLSIEQKIDSLDAKRCQLLMELGVTEAEYEQLTNAVVRYAQSTSTNK